MNAVLRGRLEMAVRTRDFLRAHRTEVAGEATALARLEELLKRAETLMAQQRAGVVATRSATVQRTQLREEIQKLLRFLAGVGVVAAKENADLAAQFLFPRTSASNQALLTAARDHVGASADLAAVATEIAEQVRLLDGLVRYRFGDNAELMGAWSSARNPSLRSGRAVLGPFRSRSEPDAGAGDGKTPSEAGPDVVKPAA